MSGARASAAEALSLAAEAVTALLQCSAAASRPNRAACAAIPEPNTALAEPAAVAAVAAATAATVDGIKFPARDSGRVVGTPRGRTDSVLALKEGETRSIRWRSGKLLLRECEGRASEIVAKRVAVREWKTCSRDSEGVRDVL